MIRGALRSRRELRHEPMDWLDALCLFALAAVILIVIFMGQFGAMHVRNV